MSDYSREITPPKNLSSQEKIAWFESRMKEISQIRQYLQYELGQVDAVWNPLQRGLIETQREVIEVKVCPPGQGGVSRPRKVKQDVDVAKALREAKISPEEKERLAKILGIEI